MCFFFYLISQESQLGQEVLREFEFVSHCALLHLCPHGFSLLTNRLLKPYKSQRLMERSGFVQLNWTALLSFLHIPLLTGTASVSPCPVWFYQTDSGPCLPMRWTDWKQKSHLTTIIYSVRCVWPMQPSWTLGTSLLAAMAKFLKDTPESAFRIGLLCLNDLHHIIQSFLL